MAPMTPEEIDVFKIPHSRMKELVYKYCDLVQTTNFSDVYHLNNLLKNLIRTFHEFIAHEQIENKYIMKKLKNKLRSLSIQNTAVCNCHKDNQLTDMLSLIEDGYKCTKKSDTDRKNFGIKLRNALEEFTKTFIPHMAEEEEVFQPLLMEHFTFEELKQIKCVVLEQHFKVETEEEKFVHDSQSGKQEGKAQPDDTVEEAKSPKIEINSLPDEILLKMFTYLNPKDLSKVSEVSKRWNDLAYDSTLWKDLYPVSWANGDWDAKGGVYDEESQDVNKKLEDKMYDEDADIDESDDWDAESIEIQRQSSMLTSMCKHLLPRVGSSIQKCDLAYSKGITNGTLFKILSLCPNLEYLDLTQTRISDLGFKGLEKEGCGNKLRHLDLTGCLYITDLTLQRVSTAMGKTFNHKNETEYNQGMSEEVQNETGDTKDVWEEIHVMNEYSISERAEKESITEIASESDYCEQIDNEGKAEYEDREEKKTNACRLQEETPEDNENLKFCRLDMNKNSIVCVQCTDKDKVTHCRNSGQREVQANRHWNGETGTKCIGRETQKAGHFNVDCDMKTDCDRIGSHSARADSHGSRPCNHGDKSGCHGDGFKRSCHKFCASENGSPDTKHNPDISYKGKESETLNRAKNMKSCIAGQSNTSDRIGSEAHDQKYVEPPCWNDDNGNKKPDMAVVDAGDSYKKKKPNLDVPELNTENQRKKPDPDVNEYPVDVYSPPIDIKQETPNDIDKLSIIHNESPDTNENEEKRTTVNREEHQDLNEIDDILEDGKNEIPDEIGKLSVSSFGFDDIVDVNEDKATRENTDQNLHQDTTNQQEGPLIDIKEEMPNEIDKTPMSIIQISDTNNENKDKKTTNQVDMHNKINIEGPLDTPVVQTNLDDLVIELQDGSVILDLTLKIQEEGNETFVEHKSDPVPYKTFTHVDHVHFKRQRRLEYLSLSGCYKITDTGIEHLTENGGLPYLRYLDLSGCQLLSGQAVSDLVDTATMLDPSNLCYCDNIMDGPYPDVASGCQNLQCSSRMCCRGAE